MKKVTTFSRIVCISLLFAGSSFTGHDSTAASEASGIGQATASVRGSVIAIADGAMTAEERKFAIDLFVKTKQRLLDDVKGLSQAQLNWKADTSRWSVFECTEHIALAESLIWNFAHMTEMQPANPERKGEIKVKTDQMLAMVEDRSHKVKAPAVLEPTGKFEDIQASMKAFTGRRDSTIAYLQTTQDEMHNHIMNHPVFGPMDVYQGLIFLAGHCARHTAQLEEVKANPNFPKQ